MKIEKRRANVFFGFFNKYKFLKFKEYCFFSNKLRFFLLLKLVGSVSFLFFNFNFYNNMYYIYNFIKKGTLIVDNKIINNPHYTLNLFQNLTVSKRYVNKLYLLLKFNLKNRRVFFNIPPY